MCGRYVSVQSDADLLDEFDALPEEPRLPQDSADPPRREGYNNAPTDAIRAVVTRRLRDASGAQTDQFARQLRTMRWGLVPSWAKDRRGAARLINARIETVGTTAAFRRAWAARRCLIPADGWYEWRAVQDANSAPANGKPGRGRAQKQPYYLTRADGEPIAFAGLYEFWGPPGQTVTTCTIITAPATGPLGLIHDRMPLVAARADWARWLDPELADPSQLTDRWQIEEGAPEAFELRAIGTEVNAVRHDGPQLLAPAQPAADPAHRLF